MPLAGRALLHLGMVWTGGRGSGQAIGETVAMQEQTGARNPLTPGPQLLSTGTGRAGKREVLYGPVATAELYSV